jgi:acyl-CoA thioesterase YciA
VKVQAGGSNVLKSVLYVALHFFIRLAHCAPACASYACFERILQVNLDDDRVPPDEPAAIRVTAMPTDTNPDGDIFGGWLVSQIDLAASAFASRHRGERAVTAAIDAISFLRPVKDGDEVSAYASLVSVRRRSMHIAVEARQRDRNAKERDEWPEQCLRSSHSKFR